MKHSYLGCPSASGAAIFSSSGIGRLAGALLLALSLTSGAQAQKATPQFFQADGQARNAAVPSRLAAALRHSQALTLDVAGLRAALTTAPLETRAGAAPLVLALPLPNGGTSRFALREAPVMEPALAAQFPEIKTYSGVGLDDAAASVRLDLSPQGFHAQVLTTGGNSFYIDPVSQADPRHCLAFYRRDMNRTLAGTPPACGFKPTVADQ